MSRRRAFFLFSSAAVTLLLVAGMSLSTNKLKRTKEAPPFYGIAPDFELTDSLGENFSSKSLLGNVSVVNFIFTSCPGVCPLMSHEMAKLKNTFGKKEKIRFVSISVDPENDTPEKLSEYAKRFHGTSSVWHFLTGEKETIVHLMNEGFKLGFDEDPVFHSDYFVLLDSQSRIRGYYSFANKDAFKKLPGDILALLKNIDSP